MKSPLLALLLLGLCVPGQCGCQADCLACTHALPRELRFSTVVCVMECEGAVAPAYTWDLCRRASAPPPQFPSLSLGGAILKRAQEQAEQEDQGEEDQGAGPLLFAAPPLRRYDHVSRSLDQLGLGSRTDERSVAADYNSQNAPRSEEEAEDGGEEEEEEEEEEGERGQEVAGLSVSKRFGGFLKGKHGYRKLMDPGRSFQKRYGGFIGVRKSARKWNNQKRVSEFLKQYLGMSTRASEYNSVSEGVAQQNQV